MRHANEGITTGESRTDDNKTKIISHFYYCIAHAISAIHLHTVYLIKHIHAPWNAFSVVVEL